MSFIFYLNLHRDFGMANHWLVHLFQAILFHTLLSFHYKHLFILFLASVFKIPHTETRQKIAPNCKAGILEEENGERLDSDNFGHTNNRYPHILSGLESRDWPLIGFGKARTFRSFETAGIAVQQRFIAATQDTREDDTVSHTCMRLFAHLWSSAMF